MVYFKNTLLFLLLNFAALGIGSILMGGEVTGEWYQQLNKAPWTPPGYVFGLAWSSIMICFSFFLARLISLTPETERKSFWIVFGIQWLLNVLWNPLFFYLHLPTTALIEILLLLAVVGYYVIIGIQKTHYNVLLVLPYFLWMIIATSLNAYVVWAN